jgi:hypothetical protein
MSHLKEEIVEGRPRYNGKIKTVLDVLAKKKTCESICAKTVSS